MKSINFCSKSSLHKNTTWIETAAAQLCKFRRADPTARFSEPATYFHLIESASKIFLNLMLIPKE